ncbi:PREDICTED: uncharacterized protein LOC105366691 isoform X2 [Ceratosolen solmsi marchali]|uniref:Glycosyltransferase family 92 protein n=1 Tax=Ceratosolen solmsi marchali TaxID=326594 RepID=A0AAJ6YSR7_9HYME|nr:PREDICTED: uncharacterized protein LOC105366691 isoform X2 [Ceratosolen solmsi marchali]
MGARRSGSSWIRSNTGILKERANMSFMLVVMFFAVFGLIVLTEIFLIDDKHSGGISSGLNGHRFGPKLSSAPDRPDYEEIGLVDYTSLKGGLEERLSMLVRGAELKGALAAAMPIDPRSLSSIPINLEARLPQLDKSLRITHAEWLPVTNTRFKFFVYSAYYDERVGGGIIRNHGSNSGVIRVIGATKTRGPEKVWCRLWYLHNSNNITTSITVAAKVKVIRENWNLKYSACFVICPLPKESHSLSTEQIPEAVSIVARLRASPTNRIVVQNRPVDRPKHRQSLAVCIKPLHYDYNRVLQLVEFIELHKILGASHVTLYNDSLGSDAGCALNYYEGKGLVTLLPWHHLDMISQREIRTEGLFAALNDCLYRSMYTYEYLALLDLDEFIIPRHEDTILDLIRLISRRSSSKTASAYSFQNAFFYLQWPDDPYVTTRRNIEASLVTLRKTRRRSKLHPHKQRSKYVTEP